MITRASGQGYWNYVVSIMVVVAVVYVTVNGDLPKWFKLLSFTPAPPPTAGTGAIGATPGQPGLKLNPLAGMPTSLQGFLTGGLPGPLANGFKALGGLFGGATPTGSGQ